MSKNLYSEYRFKVKKKIQIDIFNRFTSLYTKSNYSNGDINVL